MSAADGKSEMQETRSHGVDLGNRAALVRRLHRTFRLRRRELYLVGGAVRDALLGLPIGEIDFATSATPEETCLGPSECPNCS